MLSDCCKAPLDEAHHNGRRYKVCASCMRVTHETVERPSVDAMKEQAEQWQPVPRGRK